MWVLSSRKYPAAPGISSISGSDTALEFWLRTFELRHLICAQLYEVSMCINLLRLAQKFQTRKDSNWKVTSNEIFLLKKKVTNSWVLFSIRSAIQDCHRSCQHHCYLQLLYLIWKVRDKTQQKSLRLCQREENVLQLMPIYK